MRTLLHGGTVVDGTGREPFRADVLIEDARIAAIGRLGAAADARAIDCAGLTVAPGFIDGHSHSDLQALQERPEKALQGVTTEVVGNCGFSPYPAAADPSALRDFANGIFCGGDDWGWPSAAEYLASTKDAPFVRVASLLGHGSLRIAVAGTRLGSLEPAEVDRMEHLLDESLAAGACGFSTGLMYSPGESAPFEELERLCGVVARRGKVYATHMRDYGSRLLEALDEQIALARATGCRLQISHLQAVGIANWPRQASALEKIERARDEGIDIAFDCYPYVAGSTVLTQLLPQRALAGGIPGLMARLTDPVERARLASETIAGMVHRWTDILISAVESEANRPLVGMTIEAIAEERGCEPIDAVLDILVEERGAVNMLEFNQSEDNLRQTLTHSLSNIISDGFYVKGRPHPRLYGTFPEMLGRVCREKRWLDLATAVHKMTGRPAERFGMRDRGRLEPGYCADVVVFDAARVGSPATYEDPKRSPEGIRMVLREGRETAAAQ